MSQIETTKKRQGSRRKSYLICFIRGRMKLTNIYICLKTSQQQANYIYTEFIIDVFVAVVAISGVAGVAIEAAVAVSIAAVVVANIVVFFLLLLQIMLM